MNIGIAGAGLLGRLLAWHLVRAGHEVDVFDPAPHAGAPGAAGWTAAGMLSPVAELECGGERVFRLGMRSMELWPRIVRELPAPVELRMGGSLLLAHRGDEGVAERTLGLLRAGAPAPHSPEPVPMTRLAEIEPSVHGPAHAWLLPREGCIHAPQAMQALVAGAGGARWHWNTRLSSVAAGRIEGRTFDRVYDTRGVGAKPQLKVRGVRGEIFWLHAPGVKLHRPLRLLHARHSVYLVPRADDIVVVGASEVESEDRSPVSLRSTVELLAAAHSIVPELAEARVVHSEANLRPAMPDNLPFVHEEPGLTRINGLFRHGWLVAPALVEGVLP